MPLIRYDAANMFSLQVGKTGAKGDELQKLHPKLTAAKKRVLDDAASKRQGWLALPDDTKMLRRIAQVVKDFSDFQTLLVIGIGGSDLGTRAIYQALGSSRKGMKLVFAGANTDPDELQGILSNLDWSTTLINIISKSGDTIEPMATFLVVYAELKKKLGAAAAGHIIATTDAEKGTLRDMAQREGFRTLPVPSNVGGRFSVLSDVSLFPLACAGIRVQDLLAGARDERDTFLHSKTAGSAPEAFAALQFLAATTRDQPIQVLMPYASSLREFGFWYRQLWAESLGKKTDRNGKIVHTGPTPIAALGATDQHSQIQLYNEGPFDKTVTFIEIETFRSKLSVPRDAKNWPTLAELSGISFETIIHAERSATAESLRANHRPNGTIFLPTLNEKTLGALILFFELATAISGELYEIDAYNQPGVEVGKKLMKEAISTSKK